MAGSNSEIIRSFLVSVGVVSDDKGTKKFADTVKNITKVVGEFALAAAAAAEAASVAVVKISGQFEDLYYASQRLRSSVDNIKAFDFGISQMGGNAQSARQSLEAFASFMRSNPMGEGLVRGLGVETRDAAGNAREYADVLRDLGAQLRQMPYWAAKQRANLLGIDENTLQALLRGTDLWSDRYRKLVADSGVNMDKMAADAANLMQSFRLLRAELEIYLYKAISKIDPELLRLGVLIAGVGGGVALLTALLGPEVAAIVALGAAIAFLADDFEGWKKGQDSLIEWGEWAPDIQALADALGDVGRAFVDAAKAAWAFHDVLTDEQWSRFGHGLLRMLTDITHMFADLVRIITDLANMDFKKMGADIVKLYRDGNDRPFSEAAFAEHEKAAAEATAKAHAARAAPPAANDGGAPAGGDPAAAMAYFMRQGWTKEQAAGIVANLQRESGLNPHGKPGDNGQARGIAQWHPDRQRDFAQFAGHDLANSSLTEQLAFVNYELTRGRYANVGHQLKRAGDTAGRAAAMVSAGYERPKQASAEAAARARLAESLLGSQRLGGDGGAKTVTIHSKTEIKVTGATDPHATGKAVGTSVDRANSDLVRNTKTAVR